MYLMSLSGKCERRIKDHEGNKVDDFDDFDVCLSITFLTTIIFVLQNIICKNRK